MGQSARERMLCVASCSSSARSSRQLPSTSSTAPTPARACTRLCARSAASASSVRTIAATASSAVTLSGIVCNIRGRSSPKRLLRRLPSVKDGEPGDVKESSEDKLRVAEADRSRSRPPPADSWGGCGVDSTGDNVPSVLSARRRIDDASRCGAGGRSVADARESIKAYSSPFASWRGRRASKSQLGERRSFTMTRSRRHVRACSRTRTESGRSGQSSQTW